MKSQEIIDLKLLPALKECRQHQLRLHAAWAEAHIAVAGLSNL